MPTGDLAGHPPGKGFPADFRGGRIADGLYEKVTYFLFGIGISRDRGRERKGKEGENFAG
jgi:hypothetical protein